MGCDRSLEKRLALHSAESLRAGTQIEIRGFGSFGIRHRAARTGRNPKTREAVHVPAKRVCYFKPGKLFLEIVNSSAEGLAQSRQRPE